MRLCNCIAKVSFPRCSSLTSVAFLWRASPLPRATRPAPPAASARPAFLQILQRSLLPRPPHPPPASPHPPRPCSRERRSTSKPASSCSSHAASCGGDTRPERGRAVFFVLFVINGRFRGAENAGEGR